MGLASTEGARSFYVEPERDPGEIDWGAIEFHDVFKIFHAAPHGLSRSAASTFESSAASWWRSSARRGAARARC